MPEPSERSTIGRPRASAVLRAPFMIAAFCNVAGTAYLCASQSSAPIVCDAGKSEKAWLRACHGYSRNSSTTRCAKVPPAAHSSMRSSSSLRSANSHTPSSSAESGRTVAKARPCLRPGSTAATTCGHEAAFSSATSLLPRLNLLGLVIEGV